MGRRNPWYHPNCADAPLEALNAGNAAALRRRATGWLKCWRMRKSFSCRFPLFCSARHSCTLYRLCIVYPNILARNRAKDTKNNTFNFLIIINSNNNLVNL